MKYVIKLLRCDLSDLEEMLTEEQKGDNNTQVTFGLENAISQLTKAISILKDGNNTGS